MIESHQIPDTNILEFTLDGAFTREDYDKLTALADDMIAQHGTIKMIEIIRDIGKMEPSAIWADFKWAPRHMKYLTRIAVVADKKWIGWMVGPMRAFISAEVLSFHLDEIDEARRWVAEEVVV